MTVLISHDTVRNHLLALLDPPEFARLQPHLERRSFEQGSAMEMPDTRIERVCFPEPGVVSVVARTAGGTRLDAGLIGPEGMTGLPLLHGLDRSSLSTFVQVPCRAICLDAVAFHAAIRDSRALHDHFLRYAQIFSIQLAQAVLCNGRFTLDERLARWLLMCHDRVDREDLPLTHELLAVMLGVRRAGVTTGLRVLEGAGAVKTRRGGIDIRDRVVLAGAAGEAYGVPEAEYARVFGRRRA